MLDREKIEIPFPHTSIYAGSHSEPFRVQLMAPPGSLDSLPNKEQPDVHKDS